MKKLAQNLENLKRKKKIKEKFKKLQNHVKVKKLKYYKREKNNLLKMQSKLLKKGYQKRTF